MPHLARPCGLEEGSGGSRRRLEKTMREQGSDLRGEGQGGGLEMSARRDDRPVAESLRSPHRCGWGPRLHGHVALDGDTIHPAARILMRIFFFNKRRERSNSNAAGIQYPPPRIAAVTGLESSWPSQTNHWASV